MNYEEYSKQSFNNLVKVQEKFKEAFEIDSYANWFYDSETELLRLYDHDDEIYFKYIPIGTYSLKSATWMWSWFNNHSIEKSRSELLLVKEFGIENNYEKLHNGTFSSDEYDGWELSSICLHFVNGIGIYKVNTDELDKYMLITDVIDKSSLEIKKLRQKTVDCGNHGYSRPAFVCQHLNLETPKGFEEAFETYLGMDLDEDDDFQAWCSECEKVRIEYNGWNDESEEFAGIKLVCENCYFELKNFNQQDTFG
ncbi:hypothetical protein J2787_004365 [Chryseobacterium rhizosphaerae]|jgi:hypothetical protein|uniref:Uncharacterized protein n=1 Tax=Chryseobacterium rhizosphaerae TaxID=395937 RepID=A0AAE3YF36_9FLAO|nr:DUF6882 domain-containing protein [Chryseobacterium rhizosphaerae]MDR6528926.1 hypothetical protein [Chryseobacterium rhizosphaerae]